MNRTSNGKESAATKAARELAQLRQQAEQARSALARLHQDVIDAENSLDSNQSTQLLEANEQLTLAALHAQGEAEAASRALDELSQSAQVDGLTGLPNRVLLLDRFAGAIAFAKRHGTRIALLFLDLNKFKQINDTLGHAVGDEVLKLAAKRFSALVREEDTVCRYGGDEFLILLTEVSHASDSTLVADKVIAALAVPSRVGDHVLRLTASIGISVYPDDGEDAQTLIDHADAAMYRAKRLGLGGFVFHGEEPPSARSVQLPALASLQRPFTHYESASAEHEQHHMQLREANGELVLAALSAQELLAAAELAQQKQKEFLAVVAHELRNPLTPIRIAAEMLGLVGADEMPRYQAIIEQEVEHMARLVSDLLDVSRANTGKLRLERQVVDLASIIDEAVGACRPAMDTRMQRFSVQVPPRALEVDGDPVRLAQILRNLLDNASKYTQKGGEIGLSVTVEGDAIAVTVSDSGIGITADALRKVFEPFVQEPHAIGFSGAGLGIGLTVVRELAESHGGAVVAHSAGTGLGSKFVVTLPLVAPKPPSRSRRRK
ncbi:diguanylate cyclase domain-containing protein [Montanilutibacter psychrotolerans]|uniref:histidine kinase n=1 Tax=Montanilutibacter psychrotolerans TaxID=1327343 RepID=A0A3M8SV38_9GAMM|nr:diguanylate cyclase [Lysobacter psychrotolerans]RNF83336.1 diguanylate cyclase [Lysobacter psychrotolerans]